MCQREGVQGNAPSSPLSETERRTEIDMRVGALLAKREAEQFLYRRGFWDCLYLVMILLSLAFIFWPEISAVVKKGSK